MKKMSLDDAIVHLLHEATKPSAAYSRYAKTLRAVSSLPIDDVAKSRVMGLLGYWKAGEPVGWLKREIIYRYVHKSRTNTVTEGK